MRGDSRYDVRLSSTHCVWREVEYRRMATKATAERIRLALLAGNTKHKTNRGGGDS